MWALQFADALHTSDALGLKRFATMQNQYKSSIARRNAKCYHYTSGRASVSSRGAR